MEQKPIIEGRKNPDYLIDGEIFDNYAPITKNLRTIRDTVAKKVDINQAKNLIINLRDSKFTKSEIELLFTNEPVTGLNRLWIVDTNGQLLYIIGVSRWK